MEETTELFQDFKSFVELIPAPAFKPYYTTDFRIMTGRYYRVTVNKCRRVMRRIINESRDKINQYSKKKYTTIRNSSH